MTRQRPLKKFSGRIMHSLGKVHEVQVFIAAYSKKHAAELLGEFAGQRGALSTINDYFGSGSWGTQAEADLPQPTEPGLWVAVGDHPWTSYFKFLGKTQWKPKGG